VGRATEQKEESITSNYGGKFDMSRGQLLEASLLMRATHGEAVDGGMCWTDFPSRRWTKAIKRGAAEGWVGWVVRVELLRHPISTACALPES